MTRTINRAAAIRAAKALRHAQRHLKTREQAADWILNALRALPPAQPAAPDARVAELEAENRRIRNSNAMWVINFERVFKEGVKQKARADKAEASLAAAPAVKVKPLEWEHGHKFCGQDCSYADTEFGAWMMVAYSGRGGRWAHTDPAGNDSDDDWETRDECQAAANADYQARILAALEGLNDG